MKTINFIPASNDIGKCQQKEKKKESQKFQESSLKHGEHIVLSSHAFL